MSSNYQKTPLGWALNAHAAGRARDIVALLSKSPPCHVTKIVSSGIVTVQFDVQAPNGQPPLTLPEVTMPVAMYNYDRMPIQVGDKGVAAAGDFSLAGASGQGPAATTTQQSNLTPLFFVPLGNTGWSVVDLNTHVIIGGPNGTIIQNKMGDYSITIPASGALVIQVASGQQVKIMATGGTAQPVKLASGANSTVLMAQ